jgi:hypothetical protein
VHADLQYACQEMLPYPDASPRTVFDDAEGRPPSSLSG